MGWLVYWAVVFGLVVVAAAVKRHRNRPTPTPALMSERDFQRWLRGTSEQEEIESLDIDTLDAAHPVFIIETKVNEPVFFIGGHPDDEWEYVEVTCIGDSEHRYVRSMKKPRWDAA